MIPQQAKTKEFSGMTKRPKQTMKEGNSRRITMRRALRCVSRRKGSTAAGKKLPLKRRVKRHRFSSPFSSDEEAETGAESYTSSYAPAKLYRTSNVRPASASPLSIGREREPNPEDALEGANGRLKQRRLSRTAVVYKQQCWEGEILQEGAMRQECGRPRK